MSMDPPSRSVVIIGGSYSGLHAAEVLAEQLPPSWSVTLIERNTHFNNLYSFPRSGVIGQAQRSFIPYTGVLERFNEGVAGAASQVSDSHVLADAFQKLNTSDLASPQSSAAPPPRLRLITATVNRIVEGRVLLDRMVDSLPSTASRPASTVSLPPTLSPSARSHSEVDSGYGSSPPPSKLAHTSMARPATSSSEPRAPHSDPPQQTIQVEWDFLVYALGSQLPPPLQLPVNEPRTKSQGVEFLQTQQQTIANAQRILIVGGGALGIQYACDIAHRYQLLGQPKQVTLIHSRTQFLPTFKREVDSKVKDALARFGVNVVLGERVNLSKLRRDLAQSKGRPIVVETNAGSHKHWEADLVLLCTGQVANTALMAQFCPLAVPGGACGQGSSGLIRVNRALQVSPSAHGPSPVQGTVGSSTVCECGSLSLEANTARRALLRRVFAVGDCIDGFGAIKAGHVGWNQAEVAARNLIKLVHVLEAGGGPDELVAADTTLERYEPSPPMIKLTLGLDRMVTQLPSNEQPEELEVIEKEMDFLSDDYSWKRMWIAKGIKDVEIGDGWA